MSSVSRRLRIIGVGSPFSEDRLGLLAVEQLQHEPSLQSLPFVTEFIGLDRPGSGLISYFAGCEVVVVIDAMQSGLASGTVQRLALSALVRQGQVSSSHSLGVAETLALAEVLRELPPQLLIFGIEAGAPGSTQTWYAPLLALLRQELQDLASCSISN